MENYNVLIKNEFEKGIFTEISKNITKGQFFEMLEAVGGEIEFIDFEDFAGIENLEFEIYISYEDRKIKLIIDERATADQEFKILNCIIYIMLEFAEFKNWIPNLQIYN